METFSTEWPEKIIESLRQNLNRDPSLWAAFSEEFCRHCLTLIKTTNGDYSPTGLLEIAGNEVVREKKIEDMEAGMSGYSEHDQSLARAASTFFSETFKTFTNQAQSSIALGLISVLQSTRT